MKDINTREVQLHCAKVYLAEARRRRGQPFAATLLEWAKNCRRRARQYGERDKPAQLDMFA